MPSEKCVINTKHSCSFHVHREMPGEHLETFHQQRHQGAATVSGCGGMSHGDVIFQLDGRSLLPAVMKNIAFLCSSVQEQLESYFEHTVCTVPMRKQYHSQPDNLYGNLSIASTVFGFSVCSDFLRHEQWLKIPYDF